MNPRSHSSLGAVEDAHREQNAAARRRIEQAENYLSYYRSRMREMQESFYEAAVRRGVADDPRFRAELHRATDEIDENVHGASIVIADLEEEYRDGLARQSAEIEELVAGRNPR